MEPAQLPGLRVGDLITTLIHNGEIERVRAYSIMVEVTSVTHSIPLDDLYAMSVDDFCELAMRPPDPPGFLTFAWGKHIVQGN